jgi:hypothetical protein
LFLSNLKSKTQNNQFPSTYLNKAQEEFLDIKYLTSKEAKFTMSGIKYKTDKNNQKNMTQNEKKNQSIRADME